MAIYLGFYRTVREYGADSGARARAGAAPLDPRLQQLITQLPHKLPTGCTILGSYATIGGDGLGAPGPPSVLIVETAGTEALAFLSQYYAGFLQFQWTPARAVGMTVDEREAYVAAAQNWFTSAGF